MATSIDYSGVIKRIIVPLADLTILDAGPPVLYELDTDTFFDDVKALEANESGIVWQNAIDHNPPYTVAGETFARKIEIMNSTNTNPVLGGPNTDEYEVFFSPDVTASVKLTGSNNNLFDLQNAILANTVTQVIPTNSAGLLNADSLVRIEKFLRNRQVTNRTTAKLEQYDDTNTTIEFEAPIWEDEAGTVPYDGDAAILRKDRLEET